MTEPGPGSVVADRFLIEGEPLAQGGTGTLWPAYDELAGRAVALKIVHAHLLSDPAAVARLQAEAGAASRLRHPNLLVVHGLYAQQGRWALAVERLDGPALDADGVAPLATSSVVAIGLQLCEALLAVHDAGLVHGDVRPGHVVLADRGAVLLGLGQVDDAGTRATRPGQTAPEVAMGGPPGVPADVYGLGVTLHYALTGRMPYLSARSLAVLGAQRHAAPQRPPGPAGVAALIVDLLQPLPDRRPPDLRVVRMLLRRLQDDPAAEIVWRPRFAPLRLGGAWAVHGVDPETGGPALVTTRLPRGRARALARRLRAQGWDVRADPEGLSGGDLLTIGVVASFLGIVLPVVGFFFGAWALLRGRTARARPGLSRALPPVRAPIPPRVIPPHTEHGIAAALLLFLAALGLVVQTWWTLLPLGLLAWLIADAWGRHRRDAARTVLRARVEGALAEARLLLEDRAPPLDESLSLLGEIEVLDTAWRAGRVGTEEALVAAEAIQGHLGGGSSGIERDVSGLRDLVARTRDEVESPLGLGERRP